MPPELIGDVEIWASKQANEPGRSEAIRRLVEIGLAAKTKDRQSSDQQKQRAREMAAGAIDKLADGTATGEDQATRKRRLLKGPVEFQDTRIDRPKRK